MNPFELPQALLALLGFVAVVPVWVWFVSSYPAMNQLSTPSTFLIGLALPATAGLYLVGWLQPG